MDMMIKFDKFCGCCSLKTGAIIVGVVYILMGILYALVGVFAFSANIDMEQWINGNLSSPDDIFVIGIAYFIIGIVDILIALSLLYGAMRRNHIFLLPFLILEPFDWLVSCICLQVFEWSTISVLFCLFIKTFISGYFWVSILSFWNVMK